MKLRTKGKIRMLIVSNENNRITNKERTFFVEFLYLGKNDDPSNFEEVGREIWENATAKTDIADKEKIAYLESKVTTLLEAIKTLEDYVIEKEEESLLLEEGEDFNE